jgi:hypothetical protein
VSGATAYALRFRVPRATCFVYDGRAFPGGDPLTAAVDRSSHVALWALALAVTVSGVILHARLGPPDTYWTIDNGGKALAVRELRAGRTWLTYPGRDLDPDFAYFPQPLAGPERYAELRDGRVVSQYLSPFVVLTLPFAALFGFAGLAVLPALGAGACVAGAGLLARRRTGSSRTGLLAAGITAAASPLLFYAAAFWEHALVGAFATAALVALDDPERERTAWSGVLLAAACFLREEMALLLLAAVLVLAVRGRPARAALVGTLGVAGVGALAAFHRATTGSWAGVHLGVNRPVPFVHALDALRFLLLRPGLTGVSWLVPAAALALLVAIRDERARRFAVPGVTLLLGGLALAAWLAYPGVGDETLALIRSNSALVFVPWVLVAPAWSRRTGRPAPARVADGIVLLFVALIVLTVPGRSLAGVHPGPRLLLLPLVPVLAATLAEGIPAARRRAAAVIPLLLVAVGWNVRSLELLHLERVHAGRLLAAIRARPERVVVTPLFWLPTEMSALWDEKTFLLARTKNDARILAARLSERGESSFLIADLPGQVPGPPAASVRSVLFPDFSVDLHVVPLSPVPSPPPVPVPSGRGPP